MNWRQEAMEVLGKHPVRKQALVSAELDLERLSIPGRVPHNRDGRLNYLVYKKAVEMSRKELALWVRRTEEALKVLSREERQVLEMLYIHPKRGNLNVLLQRQGVCKTTLYRRRDIALQKFTLALLGKS